MVRGVSQRPINLDKAGMAFDPKLGFTIDEGKLTQHNGIVLCQAHSQDQDVVEDMEHFTLIFSFSPLPPMDVTVGPDDSIYNHPYPVPLEVPFLDESFDGMWKVGEKRDLSCSLTLREADVSEVSLHWVTPALMLAGMNVVDDEYYLEGGRVTVTRYAEPTVLGIKVLG